jgi:hypothetical protein
MDTKPWTDWLGASSDLEAATKESAVLQVEAEEDAAAYLIAEAYSIGALPSEMTLRNVIYFWSEGAHSRMAVLLKVLLSHAGGYWCAVDVADAALIPCPSAEPYPLLFISHHGFEWMETMLRQGKSGKLATHLGNRFRPCGFRTDRSLLNAPESRFSRAPRIETRRVGPEECR